MTATSDDGRIARGKRTQVSVIEALLGLYREGNLTPTTEEIAARVGKTSRSIYHHFQDKEALAVAVADRVFEQHRELFTARPPTGTLEERIAAIVSHRAELFEAVAPMRRSALARIHRSPEVKRQQTRLASHLREQLTTTFKPELSKLERDSADKALELLDLHTSWETWDRLRTWQSLSVQRCQVLMTNLLTQTLNLR
jgi:AcrR family transcriptional regulator